MARAYKVLGTTTDVTECGFCGRDDLRSAIALQPLDPDGNAAGEVVYYGSDCGARAAGWTQREIRRQARHADDIKRHQEQARRGAEYAAETARWLGWLGATTGETDTAIAIQQLGGFAAARAQYREAVA
jgi:hypothetical protein